MTNTPISLKIAVILGTDTISYSVKVNFSELMKH